MLSTLWAKFLPSRENNIDFIHKNSKGNKSSYSFMAFMLLKMSYKYNEELIIN